jgi:hypothetical protein
MKTDDFGDSIWYKVNCDCNSDDHITTIEFEHDKEFHFMTLNFYKKMVWTSRWGDIAWYERLWRRITCAFKMLFTGYIEIEEYVILQDEEHISSFIEALQEGKQRIKEAMEKDAALKKT